MTVFGRRKSGGTHLAHQLSLGTVVLVKIDAGSIAAGTFTVFVDIAFRPAVDGFNRFIVILITPFKISHEILIIPGFSVQDEWKLINFEFLILRGVGIVMNPLFKRNISTDKI